MVLGLLQSVQMEVREVMMMMVNVIFCVCLE